MGRVKITAREWIPNSASPVPSTYQGCLQYYWGDFGEGPGVWGKSPVFNPLLAGKLLKQTRGGHLRPQTGVVLKCELSFGSPAGCNQTQESELLIAPELD